MSSEYYISCINKENHLFRGFLPSPTEKKNAKIKTFVLQVVEAVSTNSKAFTSCAVRYHRSCQVTDLYQIALFSMTVSALIAARHGKHQVGYFNTM